MAAILGAEPQSTASLCPYQLLKEQLLGPEDSHAETEGTSPGAQKQGA